MSKLVRHLYSTGYALSHTIKRHPDAAFHQFCPISPPTLAEMTPLSANPPENPHFLLSALYGFIESREIVIPEISLKSD